MLGFVRGAHFSKLLFTILQSATLLLTLFCFPHSALAQPSWVLVGIEKANFDNSALMPNDYRKATAADGSIVVQIHRIFGGNTTDRALRFSFSGVPGTVDSRGSFAVSLSASVSGEGDFSLPFTLDLVSRARDGFERGGRIDTAPFDQSSPRQSSRTITVTFPEASSFAAFELIRFSAGGAVVNYVFERRGNPPLVPIPRITSITPDAVDQFSPDFTLRVDGSGFSSQAVVVWNERELQTNIVGPMQVEALVPAVLLDIGRMVEIRVLNKDNTDPLLRFSNPKTLHVREFQSRPVVTIDSIEVVQVTQSPGNPVELVAEKPTAVRVFLKSNERVRVELDLHGSRDLAGTMPLPGSPLTDRADAHPTIDRLGSNRDGDFMLPMSWLGAGQIFLKAEVKRIKGERVDGDTKLTPVFLHPRGALTVAYLPLPRETPDGIRNPPPASDLTSRLLEMFPIAPSHLKFVPLRTHLTWHQGSSDEDIRRQIEAVQLYLGGSSIPRDSRLQVAAVVHRDVTLLNDPTQSGYAVSKWHYPTFSGTVLFVRSGLPGFLDTIAHEVGHNLGLRHPGTSDSCNARDPHTDWPHTTATIQEVGVNARDGQFYGPDTSHDLMSYCNTFPLWISPFSYRKVFAGNLLPAAASQSPLVGLDQEEGVGQAGQLDYLVIAGQVSRSSGEVQFDPVYRVRSSAPPAATSEEGAYCLEVTSGGATVYRNCFDLQFANPETGDPREIDSFFAYVSVTGPLSEIKLTQSNSARGSLTPSANAPTVSFTSPRAGAQWTGTDQTIAWTASDADGDPLSFTVTYSSDGGATWLPLAINIPDTQLKVNAALLNGGDNLALRVAASDGLRFTEAQVSPISLRQNPSAAANRADLDFGPVPVGLSARRTLAVSNTGTGYLEIQSVTVDDPAFLIAGPALPADARPGDSRDIAIIFRPTAASTHTATLTVRTNDPARALLQILLHGAGVSEDAPFLRALTGELGFGPVEVNRTNTAPAFVENIGITAAQVTAVLNGTGFDLAGSGQNFTLEGLERRAIPVRFTPAAEGSHEGRLVVSINGSNQPPLEIRLHGAGVRPMAAGPQPSIRPGGVVNAASFVPQISPGSWVTIFGENLANGVSTWARAIRGDVLPTTLDGVQVLIDGRPAAVSFISPTQVNVQAADTDTRGNVGVQVIRDGMPGLEQTVTMRDFRPAWFTHGPGMQRYAAAVHLDGTLVGPTDLYGGSPPTRPALPGDRIQVFGTGFGPTDPPVPAGRLFQGAAFLTNPVLAAIGPRTARVEFAGLSGAGLNQLNLVVPEGEPALAAGDHEIVAFSSALPTQSGVFITIGGSISAPPAIVVQLTRALERATAGGLFEYSWTSAFEETSPKTLQVDLVLSRDEVLDRSDIVIESETVQAERGVSSHGKAGFVRLPANTTPGNYFFGVVVTFVSAGGERFPSNVLPVTVIP